MVGSIGGAKEGEKQLQSQKLKPRRRGGGEKGGGEGRMTMLEGGGREEDRVGRWKGLSFFSTASASQATTLGCSSDKKGGGGGGRVIVINQAYSVAPKRDRPQVTSCFLSSRASK